MALALGAGEADGDQSALARRAQRRQNVRRAARSGERQQHVAAPAQALDLPREHLLEAVIVGDRGQRRGVGGQRDARRSRAGPACSGRRFRRRCAGRRRRCRHCRSSSSLLPARSAAMIARRDVARGGEQRCIAASRARSAASDASRWAAIGSWLKTHRRRSVEAAVCGNDRAARAQACQAAAMLMRSARPPRRPARAARSRPRRRPECRACSGGRSWCRPAGGRAGRARRSWSGRSRRGRSAAPSDRGWSGRKCPWSACRCAAAICIRPESLEMATLAAAIARMPLRRSVPVRSRTRGPAGGDDLLRPAPFRRGRRPPRRRGRARPAAAPPRHNRSSAWRRRPSPAPAPPRGRCPSPLACRQRLASSRGNRKLRHRPFRRQRARRRAAPARHSCR